MIYDRLITVFKLDDDPSPLRRRPVAPVQHLCALLPVYHRTWFASVQAGQSVDRMVQIPATATPPDATMYANLEDGHTYRVTEARAAEDEDGRPCHVLSLHREEARYDLNGA